MSAIAVRIRIGLAGVLVCVFSADCQADDSMELARKARDVFKTHCHRCHGKDGTVEGGMSYILDRDRLVARGKIAPGKAAESSLLKRMQAGKMPPPDEAPRPNADEIKVVERWIAAGAPSATAAVAPRKQILEADLNARILADLQKADRRERRFFRYFSLVPQYNAGLAEDELQSYRIAFAQ